MYKFHSQSEASNISTINVKGNLDFKLTRQTGVNLDGGWILKPRFQLNFILQYTATYRTNWNHLP